MATGKTTTLTVSLAKHLTGESINEVLARDWEKAGKSASNFDNVGFDVDYDDFNGAMSDLAKTLNGQHWDGVTIGWCLRGKPAHTEMFERVVSVCHEELRSKPETKIMFCTGPDDLANTARRNFPEGFA